MTISLPTNLEKFVENEINSGRYGSRDELLCDAVRMLRDWKMHQWREQVQLGMDQLERGEGIVLENDEQLAAFFDEIEASSETP